MEIRKNKKGQAAIEFLMTYGWMLLVVLIVGALIFSFVDFSSLLPNNLDLSQSFRADASQILPSETNQYVRILVTYTGTKSASVNATLVRFQPTIGTNCDNSTAGSTPPEADQFIHIENLATGTVISTDDTESQARGLTAATVGTDALNFLNGHDAIITFGCEGVGTALIAGDTVEADIEIPVEDPRTGFEIKSKGSLRATIQE